MLLLLRLAVSQPAARSGNLWRRSVLVGLCWVWLVGVVGWVWVVGVVGVVRALVPISSAVIVMPYMAARVVVVMGGWYRRRVVGVDWGGQLWVMMLRMAGNDGVKRRARGRVVGSVVEPSSAVGMLLRQHAFPARARELALARLAVLPPMITRWQCSVALGVTTRTVDRHARAGLFRAVRLDAAGRVGAGHHRVLIDRDSVAAFLSGAASTAAQ